MLQTSMAACVTTFGNEKVKKSHTSFCIMNNKNKKVCKGKDRTKEAIPISTDYFFRSITSHFEEPRACIQNGIVWFSGI